MLLSYEHDGLVNGFYQMLIRRFSVHENPVSGFYRMFKDALRAQPGPRLSQLSQSLFVSSQSGTWFGMFGLRHSRCLLSRCVPPKSSIGKIY